MQSYYTIQKSALHKRTPYPIYCFVSNEIFGKNSATEAMFRSYRDTYRPAKEPTKILKFEEYNCDLCCLGGWFSETDLEIHRKTNHSNDLKEIRNNNKDSFCTVCMRLQNTKENLISHIKEKHLLSSPDAQQVERIIYICGDCGHIFFNKDLLTIHIMAAHTPKEERSGKQFTCPKCLKTVRLTSMWFHFQKHDIPSPSVCEICITQFANQTELYEHIKIHKPHYKCEQTGFHTTVKEQLVAHLKAFKDRPYSKDQLNRKLNMFKRQRHPSPFRYNIHSVTKGLILPDILDICILCREICTSKEDMAVHALRDHWTLPRCIGNLCACGEEFEFKILLKQHVFRLKGEHKPVESSSIQNAAETEGSSNSVIKHDAEESNRKIEIELTPRSEVCFSTSNI